MSNPRPYDDAPRLPEDDPLDLRSLLPRATGAIELEIGPGRGGFVFERLEVDSTVCVIGLEVRRKWATIVDERLRARGYGERARVFAEDARQVLPRLTPGVVERVFVHFPDPWWKKRHAKRRVVTAAWAEHVVRILRPGGELFVQTDVPERAEEYERMLASVAGLQPAPGGPRLDENPFGAKSPREHRAVSDGLPVHRLLYRCAGP